MQAVCKLSDIYRADNKKSELNEAGTVLGTLAASEPVYFVSNAKCKTICFFRFLFGFLFVVMNTFIHHNEQTLKDEKVKKRKLKHTHKTAYMHTYT